LRYYTTFIILASQNITSKTSQNKEEIFIQLQVDIVRRHFTERADSFGDLVVQLDEDVGVKALKVFAFPRSTRKTDPVLT
jgi:hypothetical protein